MPPGPIVIFDKSALQSLSVDESCWLSHFYTSNITPLFYVETLADLEKEVAGGRTPEEVVRGLALRTPIESGLPNAHHHRMCVQDLMGHPVQMRGVPAVAGGRKVIHRGKSGVVYSNLPEIDAFNRWQREQFLEIERAHAQAWRASLEEVDLNAIYKDYRPLVAGQGCPRTLAEVRTLADQMLRAADPPDLMPLLDLCNIEDRYRATISRRWDAHGRPPLHTFAPYAAHVATVELFFCLGIAADLIGRERPSNRVDIAYLHYLPFCMVFTSGDNLHARTVPLFLGPDQVFVTAADLKADLRRLDEHYMQFTEEDRALGMWTFAPSPPPDGDFLVSRLWDRFLGGWREPHLRPATPAKGERNLVREVEEIRNAPSVTGERPDTECDFLLIERLYPRRKGKWQIAPPGIK
jgi:hypothetical protein